MYKLIPPYCLSIHFEGLPKANAQRTDSFSIRHRAFKYILKLLTWDPARLRYSVAQCAAKHTQTVQRQLYCWKASAYGKDCADMHFHAQLLHRYSQRTLLRKQYWKITKKRKQFCRIAMAIFFNKAFHRYTSKLCSCYHCEPSPIQAKHKKLFYWIHIFCFIMTALMLIILSALQAQGQLRIRCHCNKPYRFSER